MQKIDERHENDENGNPAGGYTEGNGISIRWQAGPIPRDSEGNPTQGPNGAFVEDVLAAALGRLKYYQTSKFNCRENALAIMKIEEALHWCGHRTSDRIARGVEGSHAI